MPNNPLDGTAGRIINLAVVAAALATVPVVIMENHGDTSLAVQMADWAIWIVFVFEYVIELSLWPDRRAYLKQNWISPLVIVLSFPLVPTMLSLTRLARLGRLLRLVRLVGVLYRALGELKVVFARQSLIYVLCLTIIAILAGGAGLTLLEPETVKGGIGDGIWWAVVTAATVGYGDIAPQTFWGRAIAVVIMLAGIGLVSTLAASITSFFVGQEEGSELQELRERTVRMEAMLEELMRRTGTGPRG
ncbi:MAG: potassium channel family protein [Acidobacteriota bacterium]